MSERYLVEKECLKNSLRRCYQRGIIDAEFDPTDAIVIETLNELLRGDWPFNEGYQKGILGADRDEFAMAALGSVVEGYGSDEDIANYAYRIADAMMKARVE